MVKHSLRYVAIFLAGAITILIFTIIDLNIDPFNRIEIETTNTVEISMKQTAITTKKLNQTFIKNKPIVYLTFDDGPNKNTNKILSILKAENVHATFFILEQNLKNHHDTVKQIIRDGHVLGCHGVTHALKAFYETDISPLKEMKQCRDSILKAYQVETNLVRTPYGSVPHLSVKQKKILEDEGFELWDWNVDSYDWKTESPQQLISHTIRQAETLLAVGESPVILLHDIEVTANSLKQMISELKKHDVEFKTITENYVPVQFHVEK